MGGGGGRRAGWRHAAGATRHEDGATLTLTLNLGPNPNPNPKPTSPNPNPKHIQAWHDPKTVHAKGIFAHGNVGAVGGAEDLSLDVSMRHA